MLIEKRRADAQDFGRHALPLTVTRSRPGVFAGLLVAAGLAWWLTARRMAGMDTGPGTDLGSVGWFLVSWITMMAAMMLPSFAPTLDAYMAGARERNPRSWLPFTTGYLLAWTAAGVFAYATFELGKAGLAPELSWRAGGRWLTAGILLVAALYEFVPIKRMCLMRCRGHLTDLVGSSRTTLTAAVRSGIRSGGWCIGCSCALMVALFALGVMSLTWMALIAAIVAIQKLGPWPSAGRYATAALLALLALAILAAPHEVPGLFVPGTRGMHAMTPMR